MRLELDRSARRRGHSLIGGSPLTVMHFTTAGSAIVDRIQHGDDVAPGKLVQRLIDNGSAHPVSVTSRFAAADITAVIPTKDRDVEELVTRMRAHGVHDVIVIDDGSAVPIVGAIVRHEIALGPGQARQAGIALVTTALVACVDADVRPTDGWLDPVLGHFADDRVMLVAPRVRSRSGSTVLARYESVRSPLDLGPDPGRVRPGTRIGYVPGAAFVAVTAALRTPGFDPSLRFGEDVDLVWHLVAANARVRYEPRSVVEHEPRHSWAAWCQQRADYGSSAAPLSHRHGDAVAPLRLSPWSVATWIVLVAGEPLAAAAAAATACVLLVRKLDNLDGPVPESIRLVGLGSLHGGRQLSAAIRRAWWPMVGVAALRSRFARRTLLLAALAPMIDWPNERGVGVYPLVRLADDLAYSVGIWRGCWRERTIKPLLPVLTSKISGVAKRPRRTSP